MQPPDAEHLADVREWLDYAREDLRAGYHDLAASPPFLRDAAFHAQQAAEKALKGFLVWHDVPFTRTHDLRELRDTCVKLDSTLEEPSRGVERLTEYATVHRYPGAPVEISLEEVHRALALARTTLDAVVARLPLSPE